uniref:Uncharacterized protein n=2 Tax=Peronospora matthiolae TaxID=2874970 RepID=A0AAV1TQF8_9STRA
MKATAPKIRAPDFEGDNQEISRAAEVKMEGWKIDQLQRRLHWTQLQALLSTDPLLTILESGLIGPLRGPTSTPQAAISKMKAVQRLIQLPQGAGFVPGAFDAQVLVDFDLDQVITASRSLFKALVPLTGTYDSSDRELTTSIMVKEEDCSPAVSSHYASADSLADDSDGLKIKLMSLGPSGAALLRDRHDHPTPDTGPLRLTTEPVDATDEPDQMQIYFAKAMKKSMRDQQRTPPHSEPTSRPTPNHKVFGEGMPYTNMESADSHGSHGSAFYPDDLDIDGVLRPHLAIAKAITGEGIARQQIRMSAIADLEEFSGRNHDDDRARSWVRKVKSAFLRDQAPDSRNCLVLGDLLAGPARNWYSQLSRSTRNK